MGEDIIFAHHQKGKLFRIRTTARGTITKTVIINHCRFESCYCTTSRTLKKLRQIILIKPRGRNITFGHFYTHQQKKESFSSSHHNYLLPFYSFIITDVGVVCQGLLRFFNLFFNPCLTSLRTRRGFGASFISHSPSLLYYYNIFLSVCQPFFSIFLDIKRAITNFNNDFTKVIIVIKISVNIICIFFKPFKDFIN